MSGDGVTEASLDGINKDRGGGHLVQGFSTSQLLTVWAG